MAEFFSTVTNPGHDVGGSSGRDTRGYMSSDDADSRGGRFYSTFGISKVLSVDNGLTFDKTYCSDHKNRSKGHLNVDHGRDKPPSYDGGESGRLGDSGSSGLT